MNEVVHRFSAIREHPPPWSGRVKEAEKKSEGKVQ